MKISNGVSNQQQNSISNAVLNKIKSGEVKIRPRIYFVLKTALIISGAVVAVLFALYLISFIVFAMRATGIWFLPGFGFFGMRLFLTSLPWILILLALIFIVGLEIFAKNLTFVYRRPIIYSLLAIIVFAFVGGFIIDRVKFHENLFWRAQERRLPIMGNFYRHPNITEPRDVHRGVVSEITNSSFRIKKPDNQSLTIILRPETQLPLGKEIKEGDIVVVMGRQDDDTVYALGIRRIDDQFDTFGRPPRGPIRWNR